MVAMLVFLAICLMGGRLWGYIGIQCQDIDITVAAHPATFCWPLYHVLK